MTAGPLAYARRYADLGYVVFPCDIVTRGDKTVKQPMVKGWQICASTDHGQLSEWWGRWPGAMVGLAHRLTGTLALDLDTHDGRDGAVTLIRRMLVNGDREAATPAFRTASGGEQRIYARPVDLAAASGNHAGVLGAGLDVIAGYSILPSGPATPGRKWTPGNTPADLIPAACPEWIIEPLRQKADMDAALALLPPPAPPPMGDGTSLAYVARALDGETAELGATPQGQRHDAIHRAACNIGRAMARADRADLAGWAADMIANSGGWTSKPVHRKSIRDGIDWGLRNG